MLKPIAFAALAGGMLALAGCLTSDGLLFDSSNAREAPMAPGDYRACQIEEEASAPDCRQGSVARNEAGLYSFDFADEEGVSLSRFRSAGRNVYAAQMWGVDDQSPYYFLVVKTGDDIVMSMVDCEQLPAKFKSARVKRGDLEIRDHDTCVAKSADAVVAAVKAWKRAGKWSKRARMVYSPASS